MLLDLDKIEPGFWRTSEPCEAQLRKLMRSIREDGLKVPILVRPLDNGLYQIIDGHARFDALKLLGVKDTEVGVEEGLNDLDARILANKLNMAWCNRNHVLISKEFGAIAASVDAEKGAGKGLKMLQTCFPPPPSWSQPDDPLLFESYVRMARYDWRKFQPLKGFHEEDDT